MAIFENRDNSSTMASASVDSIVNSGHQTKILRILALIDSRLQRKVCDEVMVEASSELWNATGKTLNRPLLKYFNIRLFRVFRR